MEARPSPVRYLVLNFCYLCLFALAAWIGYQDAELNSLLLFLGVLPLVNAAFDFGSIGLTRFALRNGLQSLGWRTLAWSLGDLVAAALLFLALGCTTIAVVHGLNWVGEDDILNLPRLFADIRPVDPTLIGPHPERPSYWWLYATFLSTLVPTVLHLMVAVWAIGPALLSIGARERLAGWLEAGEGHFLKREGSLLILALWSALAIALPVIILAWLVNWTFYKHQTVGNWLVGFFEGVYGLIS